MRHWRSQMKIVKHSVAALSVLLLAATVFAQTAPAKPKAALQPPSSPQAATPPTGPAKPADCATPADPEQETKAIRDALTKSAEAWNRGDLATYMQAYWNSPETTFAGGATITRGYDNTLAAYKKGYQAPGKEMGKLDYPDISPQFLCADTALVRGKWHLKLSTGKEPHGVFTLIMKKFPEGWRIIHDHSSVGE